MTTKYLRLFFNHAASQKSEITNIGMSKYEKIMEPLNCKKEEKI